MEVEDRSVHSYSFPQTDVPRDAASAAQVTQAQDANVRPQGDARPERAVETARTLTAMVQDLVRQLEEQEAQRQELQERISALEEATRGYTALRDQLRSVITESVTKDDLENMHRV